ncbi:MAG: hypothetical protein COB66_01835 [Coxiella sp. (in: Bacteria)]|nr:MAG: hypothetical protein COB66_01835 [Coxiella sp. (in: g-proteobacteria)]
MMRQFVNNKVAFVAMEVSSHALSQGRVNGTEFDIAVFTNLTQDHLDYHGDMARYAAAKKRLFDCDTLRGGVVNIDDPIGQEIVAEKSSRYTMITYAMHQPADVMAHDIQCVEAGFKVDVETPWGRSVFDVPLLGHFNIYNCLAVIGVLGLLQVPFESMPSLIAQLQPPPGRMEVYSTPDSATIVVDFAHTPDALKQALLTLRSNCDGRLVCVFGCGGDRDQDKRIEMGRVASALCDGVIVTNDNPRNEDPRGIADAICEGIDQNKLMCIELDRRLAIRKAITLAGKDDLILIAGKGFESEQIIGDKVLPFNDGIVVKETLDL